MTPRSKTLTCRRWYHGIDWIVHPEGCTDTSAPSSCHLAARRRMQEEFQSISSLRDGTLPLLHRWLCNRSFLATKLDRGGRDVLPVHEAAPTGSPRDVSRLVERYYLCNIGWFQDICVLAVLNAFRSSERWTSM